MVFRTRNKPKTAKHRTISQKITYLLLALVVCSVLPLLAVAYWNQFTHTLGYQRQMLLAKVEALASIANSELRTVNERIESLAADLGGEGGLSDRNSYPAAPFRGADFTGFQRVLLVQSDLRRLLHDSRPQSQGFTIPAPLLAEQARFDPGRVVHRVERSGNELILQSALSLARDGAAGNAVLYTETILTGLAERLDDVTLGDRGFFLIISARGHQPQLQIHERTVVQLDENFRSRLTDSGLDTGKAVELGQIQIGDCDCHGAAALIPQAGWVAVSALPMHEFVQVMNRMDKAVFFSLCFIFFATYYSSSFAQRTLVKPISAITDTANSIHDSGNLRQTVDWESEDELGKLADTFNRMLGKLAQTTEVIEQQRRYRQKIIESIGDALFVVSKDGAIQECNPSAEQRLGYSSEALRQMKFDQLCADDGLFQSGVIFRQSTTNIEQALQHREGQVIPFAVSVARLTHEDSRIDGFVIIAKDISRQKEAEQRLYYLANHDTLTGLPNQMLLHERVQQATARLQWTGRQVAVIFMDLDQFKAINDTLGHSAGDQLLKIIAERLTAAVREGDTVARQGGDEFVILLADLAAREDIDMVAQRIIDYISRPINLQGRELKPTASLGIAVYPSDSESIEDLFRKADTAMYYVKREGRNGYRFFATGMKVEAGDLFTHGTS